MKILVYLKRGLKLQKKKAFYDGFMFLNFWHGYWQELLQTSAWALTLAQATLQSQKHEYFTKPKTLLLYKTTNIKTLQNHKHQHFTKPLTSTIHRAKNINNSQRKTIGPLQSQKKEHFSEPRESALH
jgi:glycyl-tRNA synthetase beta subunit